VHQVDLAILAIPEDRVAQQDRDPVGHAHQQGLPVQPAPPDQSHPPNQQHLGVQASQSVLAIHLESLHLLEVQDCPVAQDFLVGQGSQVDRGFLNLQEVTNLNLLPAQGFLVGQDFLVGQGFQVAQDFLADQGSLVVPGFLALQYS